MKKEKESQIDEKNVFCFIVNEASRELSRYKSRVWWKISRDEMLGKKK
jgi:hypothetical protein